MITFKRQRLGILCRGTFVWRAAILSDFVDYYQSEKKWNVWSLLSCASLVIFCQWKQERTGDTLICLIVRFRPPMLEKGSLAQHSASPLTLKLHKLKLQLQFQQNTVSPPHPSKKLSTLAQGGILGTKLQRKHLFCIYRSHDAHEDSHDMARYVWTEEETGIFLSVIRDFKFTALFDGMQQRNAALYQYLWAKWGCSLITGSAVVAVEINQNLGLTSTDMLLSTT